MPQPIVLVTSDKLSDAAQRILQDAGAAVTYVTGAITEATLLPIFAAAEINAILLRGSPPLTRRVLEAATHLKIIAKHGVGVDSVDIEAATEHGIVVVTAGDANADAVAEQSIMFMLALARRLPLFQRTLREGKWEKGSTVGREFRGRTVGIVGYGQIGSRTARMARALGANVVLYSRSRIADTGGMEVETNFDSLLARVDILSLHCPLTDKTRRMLGDRELRMMKPTALVINTSRGQVIDEPALIDALQDGRLAGAGLDTFAQEPPDPKNPLIFMDNVLCTPHVSVLTAEAMNRMGTAAATNIVGYIESGECNTANVVNPAALKR
ncbi:MAG: hydroxyacid dehydrogenase [Betaproteobacteria bacterium]|nr:hydroxyacid dehydrogenase [Betaproteobacteria bacterium]